MRRDLAWTRQLLARPRLALGVTVAALLIAANWVIYVAAVIGGHTTEAALGYFLNPIVTVALGVVVLRERLRPLQWAAVAIGAVAGVYLSVAGGQFPLIALSLAFSFGRYGLVKKKVGASLEAMHSLAAETAVLVPVAVVLLGFLVVRGETTFTLEPPVHTALLSRPGWSPRCRCCSSRRPRGGSHWSPIGLLQFVTPVLQLLCGVLLLGEHMSTARWIGFGIVWVALLLLTVDSLVGRPGRARAARLALEESTP